MLMQDGVAAWDADDPMGRLREPGESWSNDWSLAEDEQSQNSGDSWQALRGKCARRLEDEQASASAAAAGPKKRAGWMRPCPTRMATVMHPCVATMNWHQMRRRRRKGKMRMISIHFSQHKQLPPFWYPNVTAQCQSNHNSRASDAFFLDCPPTILQEDNLRQHNWEISTLNISRVSDFQQATPDELHQCLLFCYGVDDLGGEALLEEHYLLFLLEEHLRQDAYNFHVDQFNEAVIEDLIVDYWELLWSGWTPEDSETQPLLLLLQVAKGRIDLLFLKQKGDKMASCQAHSQSHASTGYRHHSTPNLMD
eukprot:479931-Rhodomonas_salina.2